MKTKRFTKYGITNSVNILSQQMSEIDKLIELLSVGLKADGDESIPQAITFTEAERTIREVVKALRIAVNYLETGITGLD
jgi:hypothetical protein